MDQLLNILENGGLIKYMYTTNKIFTVIYSSYSYVLVSLSLSLSLPSDLCLSNAGLIVIERLMMLLSYCSYG